MAREEGHTWVHFSPFPYLPFPPTPQIPPTGTDFPPFTSCACVNDPIHSSSSPHLLSGINHLLAYVTEIQHCSPYASEVKDEEDKQ